MSEESGAYAYPARFEPDLKNGGFQVSFRDWPGVTTQGDDEGEAYFMAQDALAMVVDETLDRGRKLPPASPLQPGERMIAAEYHGWDDEEDGDDVK